MDENGVIKKTTKVIMLRVICVRTGDKFDSWYEDNLKYMVDKYSGLEYDEFVCIRDDVYEDDYGTFNNLLMFERFKDGQNIFFDLDVVIKGDCNRFLTEELHVCDSRRWQNDEYYKYNKLASDIVSWSGDYSKIHRKIYENLDYNYVKYHNGIDKYLYDEWNPKRYVNGFSSIQSMNYDFENSAVVFFNGHYKTMRLKGWWNNYTLDP